MAHHFHFNQQLGTETTFAITHETRSIRLHAHCSEPSLLAAGIVLEAWTNLGADGDQWRAVPFERCDVLSLGDSSTVLLEAVVSLEGSKHNFLAKSAYELTYRLRYTQDNDRILWLGSGENAHIKVHASRVGVASLADMVTPVDDRARLLSTAAPQVLIIECDLSADLQSGQLESFKLAQPKMRDGLVLERSKPTWFVPRLLAKDAMLRADIDAQLLIFRTESESDSNLSVMSDEALVYYPFCTPSVTSTLRGDMADSSFWLRCELDANSSEDARGVVAVGWTPLSQLSALIEQMVSAAREYNKNLMKTLANDAPRSIPSSLQVGTTGTPYGLGVCTWNALGQDYKLSQVESMLTSLEEADLLECFDSLLLDDGWQYVDGPPEKGNDRRLVNFGAMPGWNDLKAAGAKTSPKDGLDDLEHAIRHIKAQFPSIRRVGVWLTMQGYWGGVSPDSALSKRYQMRDFLLRDPTGGPPNGDVWHLPSESDAYAFWSDFFHALKSAGVDFVKVDNQAHLDYVLRDAAGRAAGKWRQTMSKAMREAAKSAGLDQTDCMAGSPRTWSGPVGLSSKGVRAPLRTSDDFLPLVRDSHRHHVYNNATTALLHNALHILPDFDMFQSSNTLGFTTYHAAFNAMTTAPLYLTDEPGKYDGAVIRRLVAQDSSGAWKACQARTSSAGKVGASVFEDNLGQGFGPALFIARQHEHGLTLGFWNTRAEPDARAYHMLTRGELQPLLSSGTDQVLLFDAETMNASIMNALEGDPDQPIAQIVLQPETWRTMTTAFVRQFDGRVSYSLLGLIDKYASLSPVERVEIITRSQNKPEIAQTQSRREEAMPQLIPFVRRRFQPNSKDLDVQALARSVVCSPYSSVKTLFSALFAFAFLVTHYVWQNRIRPAITGDSSQKSSYAVQSSSKAFSVALSVQLSLRGRFAMTLANASPAQLGNLMILIDGEPTRKFSIQPIFYGMILLVVDEDAFTLKHDHSATDWEIQIHLGGYE
ncbi:glycoside hydrolase family 36 protein [Mixia osmundae IAM 14324]|uniref:Uncharacterized protein n=1 Tax=Mixia osmundae (strain CBS 9802 / IAM 14324 / JCM 22182 / KY 12970) TaxID=764103 RepID=G7E1U8_MIXOS|nr:glycoside hydrolase family 36 protein [Mixia osmundae IAM 14324]KEI36754.1 glycoside hydrolase family 36 protein [Mixia osmundae IAM 14324]GAA96808.1 hypothetical protein E5Q_03480 [Mixia osmundae IAM 14324]